MISTLASSDDTLAPGSRLLSSHDVITVGELLKQTGLRIPDYQRPYKWTATNVLQLFSDLATFSTSPAPYRLGSIVLHRDPEQPATLNIVDGQQRTVTLLLIALALHEAKGTKTLQEDLHAHLDAIHKAGLPSKFMFPSATSARNLRANRDEIRRLVQRDDFDEKRIDFLLNRCEVVIFILDDLGEAFQFFDSQNARGKALQPHDLLKAYHLREFAEEDEQLKYDVVENWEKTSDDDLTKFFADYWFPIRAWARQQNAHSLLREDLHFFKGLPMRAEARRHPHGQPMWQLHQSLGTAEKEFPFQLDQTILNGRRFFQMVHHYQSKLTKLRNNEWPIKEASARTKAILETMKSYEGGHRKGDLNVRRMFDCLLFYYTDRFGTEHFDWAVDRIFLWSYHLLLRQSVVRRDSVEKYVREDNAFSDLRNCNFPDEFLLRPVPGYTKPQPAKVGEIAALFPQPETSAP